MSLTWKKGFGWREDTFKLCHMLIGSECKWHIKVREHNVIDLVEGEVGSEGGKTGSRESNLWT